MRCVLLVLALAALIVPAGASAALRVPHGWTGMVVNRGELGTDSQASREWDRMTSSGVESVRSTFYWSSAQAHRNQGDVEASSIGPGNTYELDGHGIPTAYKNMDDIVASTASRGMTLLPIVLNAPHWAAANPNDAIGRPAHNGDYANFVTDLVKRYGPKGVFWARHPGLPYRPIRDWQVWNEPDHPYFWTHSHWVSQYTSLLKAARTAIKKADPHGRVVLGGLTYRPWKSLESLYKAHAGRLFDVAAAHPYTLKTKDVLRVVGYIRGVMRHYRDGRKPMMLTELSWPSSTGKVRPASRFGVTEKVQVQKIREVYPMLARARSSMGIERVYWYTWAGPETGRVDPFAYAGLVRAPLSPSSDSRPKPSLAAWRHVVLTLQGCSHGKVFATRCR